MGSATHQNPTIIMNRNVGNVTDSYNNCEISMSDEKRQILEWLSPLAPRERHQAVSEGRIGGVGDRFLWTNEFEKWHKAGDQDVNPVLFCYGDPGVGKTYLSSLVIDTLCDAIGGDNVAVACVYCDFHGHKQQSATGVLAALLKQLLEGLEPTPGEIKKAFERAKREVGGRALRLPEICAMLVKSLSYLRRGFICIDALDEFPTKHRPELWHSLQHILRECPNARLFVTGRPHIQEEVEKYLPGYVDIIPIKPTKGDIGEYLIMRLKKDSELDAMDAELKADILRIIPDKISGAFLLASLIMDAILEDATTHQRRQTLRRMTNGFGLGDAYSTTLSRIREQKGSKAKLGMEALMWISHSKRRLKTEELCRALAFHNVPSIKALLACTLGLVTIDEQLSTVCLVHFTLQVYLATHSNMFTTPHSTMADVCHTYLEFQPVHKPPTAVDTIPSIMPFPHPASCYWGFHARKCVTEGMKHLALPPLQRDGNHTPDDIPPRERCADSPSQSDRYHGGHPDIGGFTGLHCIAYMGITEIAASMVGMKRWDLNERDCNGATPLIWVAEYGNCGLEKRPLEQEDVNPTFLDKQGPTPLTHAVKAGHESVVKQLLERGVVNPNAPGVNGRTSLPYAAGSGPEGVTKLLRERRDVNPHSPGRPAPTPLSYAARSRRQGTAELLLERGVVNPNSPDEDGRTSLSYAAGSGHEGVVTLLPERGDFNPSSLDIRGQAPRNYATECGNGGVVSLLSEPIPFCDEALKINGATQKTSFPALSLPQRAEFGPVPRQEGIILDMRHEFTEVLPLSHPDESLSYQAEPPPSAPVGVGHLWFLSITVAFFLSFFFLSFFLPPSSSLVSSS